jgi:hypothetical protein
VHGSRPSDEKCEHIETDQITAFCDNFHLSARLFSSRVRVSRLPDEKRENDEIWTNCHTLVTIVRTDTCTISQVSTEKKQAHLKQQPNQYGICECDRG